MIFIFAPLFVLVLCLVAFGRAAEASEEKIVVGVLKGFDDEFIKKALEDASLQDTKVVFKDLSLNSDLKRSFCLAVSSGDIDLSAYVPRYELEDYASKFKTGIVSLGTSYLSKPLAFYSSKVGAVGELREWATVVLPEDPESLGRALLMLRKAGKLTLREGASSLLPVLEDIALNPSGLLIKTVEGGDTPDFLESADLVAVESIMANYADLKPLKDAVLLEDWDSPYAGVFSARGADRENPGILRIVGAFRSQAVANLINAKYQGVVIPAFPWEGLGEPAGSKADA